MRTRTFKWCSACLVLAVLAALLPVGAVTANGTTISFAPSSTTADVGDMVNVDLNISNAANMYGVEVHIAFDPGLLQVLDDDAVEPGIQILPGSMFPKSDPSFIALNSADNTAGTIDFAIALLAPESPLNGSGTLATVRFSAQAQGTANLTWTSTLMASPDGLPITHSSTNGQIVISTSVIPAPGKDCSDLIDNGDFEATQSWDMPITPHKAQYTTADAHGGSRAVRLGVEPSDADVYSHSSAYQTITVPANATSTVVTFWAKRYTQETTKLGTSAGADLYDPARVINGTYNWHIKSTTAVYDWQEVLILQGGTYAWLATLMRERSNDGAWIQYSYDLSAYAGQSIVVYFNAINNGNGSRTWMYVDDVVVNSCFDDSPCVELVRNRSFEWTADWTRAPTPRPADYTTSAAHTGARSMRLGIVPPTSDTYSHSSAYQHITIPAGAPNPELTFWYKAHTEDTVKSDWKSFDWSGYSPSAVIDGSANNLAKCCGEEDWQEMLILDANYQLVSGGVVLRQNSNDGAWRQVTYDLSPYRGMTIVLYFNVINDGNGSRTRMYVDDVSVNLCGHGVRFEPTSQTVTVGQTFTMDVWAEGMGNLYGFETTIRFDPAIVQVQDADGGTPGVQVNPGAWLPGTAHIVTNTVDNAGGLITFAATLVAPEPPLNGSGRLVSIPLIAQAAGSTPLTYESLKMVNSSAEVIPTDRTNGQITVTSDQATLTGKVLLEGRTDHSGTVVELDYGATVTTGADGSYSFTTTGGSHLLTYMHPSYLSVATNVNGVAGSTTTVTTITLPAGDVNGDLQIDILDLVAVASQFGSSSPTPATADINGDGTVDIIDIVLVAKNF